MTEPVTSPEPLTPIDGDLMLLLDAVTLVVSDQFPSVSFLQRKLHINYAVAWRLLTLMEERGIVGPAIGTKQRDVLVPQEALAAWLAALHTEAAGETSTPGASSAPDHAPAVEVPERSPLHRPKDLLASVRDGQIYVDTNDAPRWNGGEHMHSLDYGWLFGGQRASNENGKTCHLTEKGWAELGEPARAVSEPDVCTGIAAMWCPVHGDCTCPDKTDLTGWRCALHGDASVHAEGLTDEDDAPARPADAGFGGEIPTVELVPDTGERVRLGEDADTSRCDCDWSGCLGAGHLPICGAVEAAREAAPERAADTGEAARLDVQSCGCCPPIPGIYMRPDHCWSCERCGACGVPPGGFLDAVRTAAKAHAENCPAATADCPGTRAACEDARAGYPFFMPCSTHDGGRPAAASTGTEGRYLIASTGEAVPTITEVTARIVRVAADAIGAELNSEHEYGMNDETDEALGRAVVTALSAAGHLHLGTWVPDGADWDETPRLRERLAELRAEQGAAAGMPTLTPDGQAAYDTVRRWLNEEPALTHPPFLVMQRLTEMVMTLTGTTSPRTPDGDAGDYDELDHFRDRMWIAAHAMGPDRAEFNGLFEAAVALAADQHEAFLNRKHEAALAARDAEVRQLRDQFALVTAVVRMADADAFTRAENAPDWVEQIQAALRGGES